MIAPSPTTIDAKTMFVFASSNVNIDDSYLESYIREYARWPVNKIVARLNHARSFCHIDYELLRRMYRLAPAGSNFRQALIQFRLGGGEKGE